MIGAVIAVKKFADAVPGLITNPGALVEAIAELIEKIDGLLQLIPQLSVPLLVLDLLDMILLFFQGMTEVLTALVAQENRIAVAQQVASDQELAELQAAVDCATDQLAAQLANLSAGAGPVDQLIGVINIFVSLVPGIPEVPTLGDLPDDPTEALAAVQAFTDILTSVRNAIPI